MSSGTPRRKRLKRKGNDKSAEGVKETKTRKSKKPFTKFSYDPLATSGVIYKGTCGTQEFHSDKKGEDVFFRKMGETDTGFFKSLSHLIITAEDFLQENGILLDGDWSFFEIDIYTQDTKDGQMFHFAASAVDSCDDTCAISHRPVFCFRKLLTPDEYSELLTWNTNI